MEQDISHTEEIFLPSGTQLNSPSSTSTPTVTSSSSSSTTADTHNGGMKKSPSFEGTPKPPSGPRPSNQPKLGERLPVPPSSPRPPNQPAGMVMYRSASELPPNITTREKEAEFEQDAPKAKSLRTSSLDSISTESKEERQLNSSSSSGSRLSSNSPRPPSKPRPANQVKVTRSSSIDRPPDRPPPQRSLSHTSDSARAKSASAGRIPEFPKEGRSSGSPSLSRSAEHVYPSSAHATEEEQEGDRGEKRIEHAEEALDKNEEENEIVPSRTNDDRPLPPIPSSSPAREKEEEEEAEDAEKEGEQEEREEVAPPRELVVTEVDPAKVPLIVARTVAYLRERALRTEGIFRESASATEMKELFQQYKSGKDPALSSYRDPNTIAGLLKLFFRESPQALLPRSCLRPFLEAANLTDLDASLSSLRTALRNTVPAAERQLLQFIISLLRDIASYQDVNKMSARNLSICWTPTLFHSGSQGSKAIEMMIDYYAQIFGE